MIFCLYIFVVFMDASLLYIDFVQSFMGNSTCFPAFSSVLTYLDLHASFAAHSILLAKHVILQSGLACVFGNFQHGWTFYIVSWDTYMD
ncbi:hypothetical protein GLYMA_17G197401v4 [Glycine max]|nr:hypothetical protein GLYMA_17G197401v4 [Glycine max]